VLAAALAAPFLVAIVRFLMIDAGSPMGDWAALDLDVMDMPVMLGSYSQYGFRHPGPLFVWWMSIPGATLDGNRPYLIGMAALAGTFLATSVSIVWRRWGRAPALVVGLGMLALTIGSGWAQLTGPWNPMVAILGAPCLVLAAACAWDGDTLASVAAVCVASFLTQAHLGNAGFSISVIAVTGVGQLITTESAVRLRRTWLVAVGVGALLWSLPIMEQLFHGRAGNVWKLVQFSRAGAAPKTGFQEAVLAGFRSFRLQPAWLGTANASEGVADHGYPVWLMLLVLVAFLAVGGRFAALPRVGLFERDRQQRTVSTPSTQRAALLVAMLSGVGLVAAVAMLGLGRGPVRLYYVVHIESMAGILCGSLIAYNDLSSSELL